MRCKTRKREYGRKKLLRRINSEIQERPHNLPFIAEMLDSYRHNYGVDHAYSRQEKKYKGLEGLE